MKIEINKASIQAKVRQFGNTPAGKAKAENVLQTKIETGVSLCTIIGDVTTEADMVAAGQHMKALLLSHASGMPASLLGLVSAIDVGAPVNCGDGKYTITLNFSGNLVRQSLAPSVYDPVDNILALFNNGYNARNFVFGEWPGHGYTGSKLARLGNHFVNRACATFNSVYGSQYHAKAEANSQYVG